MKITNTIYELLAKVNNLTQKGDVFVDNKGRKFILTRYGFQSAVNMNYKMECKKLQEELENVSVDLLRYKQERSDLFKLINSENNKQKLVGLRRILENPSIADKEKLIQLKKRLYTKDIK